MSDLEINEAPGTLDIFLFVLYIYILMVISKMFWNGRKFRKRGLAELMREIGFDNEQYLDLQSKHIKERIRRFGGKLYLEFGGKLFDDNHASPVLLGFQPNSKIEMLTQLKIFSPLMSASEFTGLFVVK